MRVVARPLEVGRAVRCSFHVAGQLRQPGEIPRTVDNAAIPQGASGERGNGETQSDVLADSFAHIVVREAGRAPGNA